MKRTYIIIALAIIAVLSMASCNSNRKSRAKETQTAKIQTQKAELADSVLSQIDAIAEEYLDATSKDFILKNIELTEAEKKVKPDYLLDLSVINSLLTKTQKVNALAYYLVDFILRTAYDMPLAEAKIAILKLAADINHPFELDFENYETQIRQIYKDCRENGELTYFWQFQHALIVEFTYITSRNPELFFNKISEGQRMSFVDRTNAYIKAMKEISRYDDEMAYAYFLYKKYRVFSSDKEMEAAYSSPESIIQFQIKNKDRYADRRNELIK